jgi:hypothetical protein
VEPLPGIVHLILVPDPLTARTYPGVAPEPGIVRLEVIMLVELETDIFACEALMYGMTSVS